MGECSLVTRRMFRSEHTVQDHLKAIQTVEDIESTARTVVGPDEPSPGQTSNEVEAEHWAGLADTVRRYGVEIDPAELAALPHDVELSRSLLAQLSSWGSMQYKTRPGPDA